ncbi:MAG: IclR family transcriptional regulator [Proteobacteria bacterium]|nr:IclR family transcriptional regulator [Pseudomonadota bacterium]
MTQDQPQAAAGTQAVRRAAAMLRAIAKAGALGDTLAGIARSTALPRPTVHRMLKCLQDEGLVERLPGDKCYRMGPLVHELGLTPASSAMDVARWRPVVEAVARRTGVTAYLMRRSGVEAVCLVKADGRAVIRFVPVEVGQRRLLGVGAGATALLSALDAGPREDVIRAVVPGLQRHPRLDAESLRAAVKLVQRTGVAISQGTVVEDGFGMGVVIPAAAGTPRLALSIAAHASTVTESRIAAWKRMLFDAVAEGGDQPSE